MKRISIIAALLILSLPLPAYARTTKEHFNLPCTAVWAAVTDTLRNSGIFEPITIDAAAMKATYKAGDSSDNFKNSVTDSASLTPQGDRCELEIDAPSDGLFENDARDLLYRVQRDLKQFERNPSALAAASAASTTNFTSSSATMATQGSPSNLGKPGRNNQTQPANIAGEQPAGSIRLPADLRITLTMTAHCAKDPDPMGFVSGSLYSGCKQKELNNYRSQIADALAQRHVVLATGDAGDLRITIMMTKVEDKRPSSLIPFGDFVNGTLDIESSYQIADASARVLHSGNINHQGPDNHTADVLKQYVAQAADTLAGQLAASAPNVAGNTAQPAPKGQTAHIETPVELASGNNLYAIMAQAYISLDPKPTLPDEARAQKYKAEQAQQSYDAKAAGDAYYAALNAANWWPEGMRGLALVLGSTGHPAEAVVWMRRYLSFVPDAPDAAVMQEKINEWSKLAPLPTAPADIEMPKGMRLGVVVVDTPAILAMARKQPDLEGALVTLVFTGSLAEKAGLQPGDILIAGNGTILHSARDFINIVAQTAAGATLNLNLLRGSHNLTLKIQF